MGDISREPLPGGRRDQAGSGKGPSELIRFEELSIEERMSEDPSHERSPSQPEPSLADAAPDDRLRGPREALRSSLDPTAPLRIDPFALEGLGAAERVDAPVTAPVDDAASSVPSAWESDGEAAALRGTEKPDIERTDDTEGTDPEPIEPPEASPESAEATAAELAADLGVEQGFDAAGMPLPATVTPSAVVEETLGDDAPELHDPAELARVALAVLLSTREPLTVPRLAEVLNASSTDVEAGLAHLSAELRTHGLPLELLHVDGAYRAVTSPAVYPYLVRLKKLKKAERLTPASLETLAVIAYRQPVLRAEIEAIRGVKAGPVLKSLLDHKLVKVVGRADVPGHPLQYGTTQVFLDRFGLRSLDDLPSVQELKLLGG